MARQIHESIPRLISRSIGGLWRSQETLRSTRQDALRGRPSGDTSSGTKQTSARLKMDGNPRHASRNLANRILEWGYGVEMKRTRLRKRPEEPHPIASDDPVSSHAGPWRPGAGVSSGSAVLSERPINSILEFF